jgi:hypothetical protein
MVELGSDFEGIHHAGNRLKMIAEDMRRLREIEEQGAVRRLKYQGRTVEPPSETSSKPVSRDLGRP